MSNRQRFCQKKSIAAKEGAEPVMPLPEVTSWDTAASDHAALWVEVDIT
ncbi:hypothetical protein [Pectobacterium odoriferum]|nr:hypothetical protein [Pectobacterium odoriferum]MBA0188838.1 hypothetical protein [Pectobacterium odoriferum]MCA6961214.1 hypothetical protein [Pectobacterium odoriferum]MCH5009324.1 hypothetical protein [Pectobacterium odoriferum]